jgi:hypothetical protein
MGIFTEKYFILPLGYKLGFTVNFKKNIRRCAIPFIDGFSA